MKIRRLFLPLFILIGLSTCPAFTSACSMYKVTAEGKTLVGCNEDAWRTTSRIWFNSATAEGEMGACFTGSRRVGNNRFAPQSGMNEKGLVFSRLASHHPKQSLASKDLKPIKNEVEFLERILQKCSSVEEVKLLVETYDRTIFLEDVFIYVDKTGRYLVVEPYKTILGDDSTYVLSNFCPSITDNESARNLARYRNGEDFLAINELSSSLDFCQALSDTMHVCRNRNGDGTLLTTIWDTKNKLVNLSFYHNYDTIVQFNLAEELAKGDHILDIPSLFPTNLEFERLRDYKTPFNTPILRILLVILGGILTLLSIIFGAIYIRKRNELKSSWLIIALSILNLILTGYLFVLATNINIYYFDAPYQHYSSKLISLSSYTPLLLLFCLIPIFLKSVNFFKSQGRLFFTKGLLTINHIIYFSLTFGFFYWGLLDIIH